MKRMKDRKCSGCGIDHDPDWHELFETLTEQEPTTTREPSSPIIRTNGDLEHFINTQPTQPTQQQLKLFGEKEGD